ncbi:MAG: type II toxin-antitoxin system HicA family toxin [Halieaceae bacterium]|nr:type II toxin-antitoxin system HicA family toxin [Halieaceae bacterium]
MESSNIIKRLLAEGWVRSGGKGSHQKFRHPHRPHPVTVPHPKKDIPVGTVRSIYRQAGWEWE